MGSGLRRAEFRCQRVAVAVAANLGGAPFIGCFRFGEQGRLMGRNVYGNLMISAVAFAR